MAVIKPFKGYRPKKQYVSDIASPAYDVINSDEARDMAQGNPISFLHVIKPEIDFPKGTDAYTEEIYKKGKENLNYLIENGYLFSEEKDALYVYAQTMWGHTQYGIIGGASSEEYYNDTIKKHELTRPDKEEDRKKHIKTLNCNTGPVFFAYHDNTKIDDIVNSVIENNPEYDFNADDGVRHQLWVIKNQKQIDTIVKTFKNEIPKIYIADGHHRAAAGAAMGKERSQENPNHRGDEEYNYFMGVYFPASQLNILDYNRVVSDLNGFSEDEFLERLKQSFDIKEYGARPYKPQEMHEFSLYLNGKWYVLKAKEGTYDDNDPIGVLDVTILTNQVLTPILDIQDLRRSERIDFVGGIRGLEALQRRVDSGEMKAAFALYPVTVDQLITISDTNNIMPPKTTWFEPKLRSGLVLHDLG